LTVLNTGCPLSIVGAALAGRHAADDVRAVREHALRVEEALAPGDALHDHLGILIEEDRHYAPAFANATARRAPSSIVSTGFIPAAARIFAAFLFVRAGEAHDERNLAHVVALERLDDAERDLIAARDAAEDVDEHRLDLRIARRTSL
jgi:hypothetical protein